MADNFLMKGKVFSEREHLLHYPCYAEIKYDEIRLHVHINVVNGAAHSVEFLSYAGKPLANMQHWAGGFLRFYDETGIADLDMGVLVNGNFNDSYRWVRSTKGVPQEKFDKVSGKTHPALSHAMLTFYLFDNPHSEAQMHQRAIMLDKLAMQLEQCLAVFGTPVRRPERRTVYGRDELDAYFIEVRERGFEGLMVKDWLGEYVAGTGHRSDWWLKLKPEDTADGKITKINRAYSIHGEPLDRAGSFDVELEDGSTASPAGIEHALGAGMWANPEKYLGQWVEFKYMERDRQGGYRHPSFVRFREDKQ